MEETKICPRCKKEIPFDSVRCCYCTSRIKYPNDLSNTPANLYIILAIIIATSGMFGVITSTIVSFLGFFCSLGLVIWDLVNVVKAKIDGPWCLWAICFYPVYIWIRDSKTGNGFGRAIFWTTYTFFVIVEFIIILGSML